MDDPRFAAGLAILRHLTAQASATRVNITLTAINMFLSFRKLHDSSCDLMSLLGSYRIATKLFEKAITTIGIRKKLTTSQMPKELLPILAIFGINDPDSQIITTYVSGAITYCELAIIAGLGFRLHKIKPEITIL